MKKLERHEISEALDLINELEEITGYDKSLEVVFKRLLDKENETHLYPERNLF